MNGIKPVEELKFTNDFMFFKVMQNPEICKELLERLLKIKIEKVEYSKLQKIIQPYYSTKGVQLDVYVKDSNRIFDVEMQNPYLRVFSSIFNACFVIFLPFLQYFYC